MTDEVVALHNDIKKLIKRKKKLSDRLYELGQSVEDKKVALRNALEIIRKNRYKFILKLRDQDKYTFREIGEKIGVSIALARALYHAEKRKQGRILTG